MFFFGFFLDEFICNSNCAWFEYLFFCFGCVWFCGEFGKICLIGEKKLVLGANWCCIYHMLSNCVFPWWVFVVSKVKVGLKDKAVFSVFVESHSHPQHVMSVMLHAFEILGFFFPWAWVGCKVQIKAMLKLMKEYNHELVHPSKGVLPLVT